MITKDDRKAIDALADAIGEQDTARDMVSLARYVDARGHGVPVVTHTPDREEVSVEALGEDLIVDVPEDDDELRD